MRKRRMPITLLLVLVFLGVAANSARVLVADGSMRFELVRGHRTNDGVAELRHTRELLQRDIRRYHMISARHRENIGRTTTRRKAREEEVVPPRKSIDCVNESISMETPMISGRDYGIGQYVVQVKVGTPPKTFRLIADTGSELTWMRCLYNRQRPRRRRSGVFLPANSSTFTTIPCSSRACKVELANLFSLTRCPTPSSPCAYDFRYADGSAALGIFANETVTADLANGEEMKLDQVLVGCSESIQGQGLQAVDGVLGLANSDHSFTAKAARKFGAKFSYCLVDHLSHNNISGYFSFGTPSHAHDPSLLADMQYTELDLSRALSPLYGVDILGISVGGTMLGIPIQVWAPNNGGGTVIDSGTSLTLLAKPAYQLVTGALQLSLSRYRRVNEDLGPLEYCFDSSGFDESQIPRLAIHFKDGAKFEPPVKSYVIDAAPGIKCLGLLSVSWPGLSVIGNILQQNHVWEFDLAGNKLGFAPSSCR